MIRVFFKLPIVLVLLLVLCMVLVDLAGIGYRVEFRLRLAVSVFFATLGLLVIVAGWYVFRKRRTTVNPVYPERATRLVTSGVYRYSRNPMYLGFLLWLVAAVMFTGNLVNAVFLPVYLYWASRLYIEPEERALAKLFGDEFLAYKSRVRRWL